MFTLTGVYLVHFTSPGIRGRQSILSISLSLDRFISCLMEWSSLKTWLRARRTLQKSLLICRKRERERERLRDTETKHSILSGCHSNIHNPWKCDLIKQALLTGLADIRYDASISFSTERGKAFSLLLCLSFLVYIRLWSKQRPYSKQTNK